jgi:hypothetical protein
MAHKINDNGIDRNMTAHEETEYEAWAEVAQTEAIVFAEMQKSKLAAREAAISKLGLSADEAQALFG